MNILWWGMKPSSDAIGNCPPLDAVVRSMVELANESVEEDKIVYLVDSLFQKAGLETKNEISFDDFLRLLSNYREELDLVGLNIRGTKVKFHQGREGGRGFYLCRKLCSPTSPLIKRRLSLHEHRSSFLSESN